MSRLPVILLVFLFNINCWAQNQNYVTVNCSQGTVRGQNIDLGSDRSQIYNGQAAAFTGVPYCQAPVGDLRLQAPQPIQQFNQTIHDATYFRPKCPQPNTNSPTNEDCLYLNIYTPQPGNGSANLSVLVLIDGSNGFTNGGCDQTEVKGIVTNLVQRKIVVVTLQYRIGALGFFTTYTNVVQSNLGMLDQVQAMRWIKSEIVNFGGNPDRITVAGHDDGACAVSAHCLSPMSQNLFNQAIVQSGSIYSCYNPTPAVPTNPQVITTTPRPIYGNAGYQRDPAQNPTSSYNSANAMYDDPNQALASTLCNVSTNQWNNGMTGDLKSCLKNYTVDFFVNQSPNGQNATWMIVRDTSFLPGSIDDLNQRRPNIPIIIGTVQDEDADYAFKLINNGKGGDPSNLDNWIFDFARRNKLNSTETNKVQNIINQNYGTAGGQQQNPTQQYQNQGQQYQNTQYGGVGYQNQNIQQQNQNQNQQYLNQNQQYQNQQYQNQNPQQQNQNQNQQYSNQNSQQTQQYQNTQYGGVVYQNQNPQQQNQNQNQQYLNQNQQYQNQGQQYQQYQNSNPLSPTNFQRDQPSSSSSSEVTNWSQLKTITQIASDQSVSLTTTQIQSFTQNGDRHVRVYQFTHVTDLGRNLQPATGADWKPVFKGQDMYFITMSETIWTTTNYTSQDRQVADNMGQRWADFVKTGEVNNWQPTNAQNYNYCNLNTQPTQQLQYAQQARQVFQDQINPICQEAQNNFAQQNNMSLPYPTVQQQVPQRTPGTANAQYSNGPNGQNFHITFQVNSFPFNG